MKKMSNHNMLQISGGEVDTCFWAGVATVVGGPIPINIVTGMIIAGGPTAYVNCVFAPAPKDK